MKEDYEFVINFLLEHPPIEEIGGPITDTIELYRYGSITKDQATAVILKNFEHVIAKYVYESCSILDKCIE